jgi:DNA-binding CsgD family transcriptional regulator/catechol 2,3-dioxygenase-like lactoylglutathione lyase family enzyme
MSNRSAAGRPPHPDVLTPAEWRVADGVRHGLSNPQIAQRQGVSPDAVKFHVSNILGKLGLTSRKQLQVWQGVAADSALPRDQEGSTTMSSIGQIARSVSDIEHARHWYREVLGLEPLFDAGNMAFFACNGVRLMLTEGEVMPESLIYFRVGDIHAEVARLTDHKVKLVSAPHKIHTHEDGSEEWMAFIEDSDGRPIGLMSTTPSN